MIGDPHRSMILAHRHLAEAQAAKPEVAPSASVHCSYYAMFHAARAVLLHVNGTASTRHGSVLTAFEARADMEGPDMLARARMLRKAYNARLETDYTEQLATSEGKATVLAHATEFVTYCAIRLGTPPTADP